MKTVINNENTQAMIKKECHDCVMYDICNMGMRPDLKGEAEKFCEDFMEELKKVHEEVV